MNNINRTLVKSQAKQLMRGKVFYLFIISFVVSILSSSFSVSFNLNLNTNNYNDGYGFYEDGGDYNGDYFEYFNDFGNGENFNSSDNPIENFSFNSATEEVSPVQTSFDENRFIFLSAITSVLGSLSAIVNIIFLPLAVTLTATYLGVVRRRPDEEFHLGSELKAVFKNSFNSTYAKKLVVALLRGIFTFLLSLLFLVPGIIYNYKVYFSYQIMNEYPNLKPTEALKLSKKMTQGHKTELFSLDLSFILWILLCVVTFGIASIYVIPYVMTTQALYYENFRLRALAEGVLTEDDFLSEQEKFAKYSQSNTGYNYYNGGYQNGNVYYTPQNDSQPQQNYTYNPQQMNNSGEYNQQKTNDNPYYTPPENQQ